MSVQHTAFVLKILSGINAGASVRLKTGTLVLGRSMTCDIILHDEGVADQHVSLLITPSSLTVYPLIPPVFIGELEIPNEGMELPLHQVVRLGNVEFMVVDARGMAARTPPTSNQVNSSESTKTKREGMIAPSASLSTAKVPKTRMLKSGHYLALGLGLLLLGNAIYFAPKLSALLQTAGVVESPEQRAEVLLTKLGKADFTLEKDVDGSVRLRGYSRTTEERNQIMQQLQAAGIQAKLRVWSQEEMADSAMTIARSLGESGVKVVAGDQAGSLNASGYVSTSEVWQHIRTSILSDVSGIQSLNDSKLQSMDSYMASFMQFVEKNGLSGRLKITTDGKRVIVKGELTQQELESLNKLHREFITTYGSTPAIDLAVVDVRSKIKLAIRSVSVGKTPFLVAKDGKKYMEGSTIGDNYFLKSIRPDHVVLVNKGMEIPFYYGIEEGRK